MIILLALPLLLCHLTVFALALPLVITNLTAEWTTPQNTEAHCLQDQPGGTVLPLLPDCMRAIRLLPQSPYIGTFHIGGASNFFQLPESESYDSCTVRVILHEDFQMEVGSWEDIKQAALRLLIACRLPFAPGGEQRTGGWITSGAENGLVVELRRSKSRGGMGMGVEVQRSTTGVDVE